MLEFKTTDNVEVRNLLWMAIETVENTLTRKQHSYRIKIVVHAMTEILVDSRIRQDLIANGIQANCHL